MPSAPRSKTRRVSLLTTAAVVATLLTASQMHAAVAATNGTTVLNGLTKPAGGVWLPGPA